MPTTSKKKKAAPPTPPKASRVAVPTGKASARPLTKGGRKGSPAPPPAPAPKKGRGRPTKLTRQMIRKVCKAIEAGNFIETSAALVGISRDTLHRWLRKGARSKSGIHRDFSDAIGVAFGKAEENMVQNLARSAGKGDARAITFWLERARQSTWGKRERLELGGIPKADGGLPITLAATVYVPAEDPE